MISYNLICILSSKFHFHEHAEITDKQLKNNNDFVWALEVPLTGKFIIDVEFLDLKTAPPDVRLPSIPSILF